MLWPRHAHLSRPGSLLSWLVDGVGFAPAGRPVFPDPVLAHGANQVGWGALPRPGDPHLPRPGWLHGQLMDSMALPRPGRPIFPGRAVAQDNSGLIGRGGGLCSGWGTPLSESGRVRERQVGRRQTFGGMGFAPPGRPIFPGRVIAQDNSGLIRRGGELCSGRGTPIFPGRVTAQVNSGPIRWGGWVLPRPG